MAFLWEVVIIQMSMIVEGQARVEKDGEKIRTLGPGDFFGEISLIDKEPRTASVTGESDMTVLAVNHPSFAHLLKPVPGLSKDMMIALCKISAERSSRRFAAEGPWTCPFPADKSCEIDSQYYRLIWGYPWEIGLYRLKSVGASQGIPWEIAR